MTSPAPFVIALTGELDVASAPTITEKTAAAIEQGAKDVVVDLGAVVFMDSTAIGALIGARDSAEKAGATLRLVNVSRNTYRLFTLTALDTIFSIELAPESDEDDLDDEDDARA